jgi:hypothetical protein
MSPEPVSCSRCGAALVWRPLPHADRDGDLWRIPVGLCTDPACLTRAGGVRIRSAPVGGLSEWPQ